jgi:hypothetical protein
MVYQEHLLTNFIKKYDNVLQDSFCDRIIEIFETSSNTDHGAVGYSRNINKDIKNSMDLHFSHVNHINNDEILRIDNVIHNVLKSYLGSYFKNINNEQLYNTNINKNILFNYKDGPEFDTGYNIQKYHKQEGYYNYHNDSSVENEKYRTITFIFYLNDVYEGGYTEFFGNYKIIPKKGSLLLFPASWLYPHSGTMPISNDKYILTGWIYNNIKKINI